MKFPFQKSNRLIRQSKWRVEFHHPDAESLSVSSAPIRRRLIMSAGWTEPCQQIYSVLCQIQNEARDLDVFYSWETLLGLRPAFSLFPSLELQDRLPEQTNMPLFLLWSADRLDRPRFLMTKLVLSGSVCTMLIRCLFCSRNQWRRFQTSVCLSRCFSVCSDMFVSFPLPLCLRDFILSLSRLHRVPEQMCV